MRKGILSGLAVVGVMTALATDVLRASDPIGVYAIVDKVVAQAVGGEQLEVLHDLGVHLDDLARDRGVEVAHALDALDDAETLAGRDAAGRWSRGGADIAPGAGGSR